MGDFTKRIIWAYRAVFTQAGAGGGAINVNIIPNGRMTVLYGMVGPDDYAADRTISIVLEDSTDNMLARMIFSSPIDNERIPILATRAIATAVADQSFEPNQHVLIGDTDRMNIKATTPIQNETLTIILRALIDLSKPTVNTAGSGGTVTTTVTYDKVI